MTMAVPASYNDQKDDVNLRAHYGWAVYQRTVSIPEQVLGRRLWLRFGAVTHAAQVWIDDTFLGEHKGGFLPFEFELTDCAAAGEHRLTVAVDNRVDFSTLPVGNEGGVAVLDQEGAEVAGAQGSQGRVILPKMKLWNPGAAYLYRLRVAMGDDVYEQAFGVRTVKVEGDKFLINGRPFYFKGFGKHEDSFFHGRGLDQCLNVKDVSLMRWLGANSFHTLLPRVTRPLLQAHKKAAPQSGAARLFGMLTAGRPPG